MVDRFLTYLNINALLTLIGFFLFSFTVNLFAEIGEEEEKMEWVSLSGGVPCMSLISLGTSYRDKYYMNHDCLCKYTSYSVCCYN